MIDHLIKLTRTLYLS